MEADSLELIDYLRIIRRRKGLIIAGTLVCMITAGAASYMLQPVYRAEAILIVEEAMIPMEGSVKQASPQTLEVYGKTYEGMLKSKAAVNRAIKEFQLDKEPHGLDLEGLNELIAVDVVKKSKLLRLTVEFPDPRLARDIANFLTERAVELNSALSAAGTAAGKDFIKEQMEGAREAMDGTENELLEFKEKARLHELKKKLEVLLSRKGKVETALSEATVDIAVKAEQLKKIEEEFGKRSRTVKLSRKLAEDPLYQQSLAGLSESDVKKMFKLTMEVEEADPTYQHLERKLVDVIPELSGLYVERASLQAELKRNTAELNSLQVELARKETEGERLQRAYNLSVDAYKMLVRRFEEITVRVASQSQDLKVLDPAVTPGKPFKPKTALNLIAAGAVGLMASLLLAFFLEYLEGVRRRERDVPA